TVARPPIRSLFPYTTLFRSRWPMTEGQVLHRDEERVVLEDPVVLPDGQQARRLRLITARLEPPVAVLPLLDGQIVLVDRFRHATDRKSTRLNSSHVKISYAV